MINQANPNLPAVQPTGLPGMMLIAPRRHADSRGYFFEAYSAESFREIGITCAFVQDNQSNSVHAGTLRGLHFQMPPFAQAKLVRVLRGSIFDVAVDIRESSPTYGQFAAVALGAENGRQLFVPAGFAHGFVTLEPHTEVFYKVDAPYAREHEAGLLWNDPALGIPWPPVNDAAINDRDKRWPTLRDLPVYFR